MNETIKSLENLEKELFAKEKEFIIKKTFDKGT